MAKILIVEDEKAINDLLKLNLEMVGHTCAAAFTGRDAVRAAGEQGFSSPPGAPPRTRSGVSAWARTTTS